MAFWDSWFAPKCEACDTKMVGIEPIEDQGKKICPTCHAAIVAKRKAEAEARRAAEEAARAKLEGGKRFGSDPRAEGRMGDARTPLAGVRRDDGSGGSGS